jgi:hypothetical protein
MRGKQSHAASLRKRLSLNDLAPFNLHPAGCRRLAIGISVEVWHIDMCEQAQLELLNLATNDIDNHSQL